MDEIKILLVNPDAEQLDDDRDVLRSMGVTPIVCLGPERTKGCALLRGWHCPKVESADAIGLELDLEVPDHRDLLIRYATGVDRPVVLMSEPSSSLEDVIQLAVERKLEQPA
ncbi:MAG TPA: hypothetical protein VE174_13395 [Actinomycetota bacterium]|nr:hypothetical protein [Actinomycetota bacterium]